MDDRPSTAVADAGETPTPSGADPVIVTNPEEAENPDDSAAASVDPADGPTDSTGADSDLAATEAGAELEPNPDTPKPDTPDGHTPEGPATVDAAADGETAAVD
ncbi:MAG: hypothetical protein ABJC79_14540, partial [Acidimicrobiia bacterium]